MRMIQPAEYLSFRLQLEQKIETLSLTPFIDLLDGKIFAGRCVDGEVDTSVCSFSQKFTTNPFEDY